ncbi:PBS lyase [Aphanothece hegewaldii CCALA 016]|uniref:PBS lyase n=1 Tax=Aphanothece hegewaldii CCALA 016 TaxID=2107694 RepID=A0A2T1M191_9CHRO|nr:HEAT repeat domain-containing protein [Aphanothece hegewaldii]PSF38434.1 PBS lyase [Aphanothece hegewaldii CCALA 016]
MLAKLNTAKIELEQANWTLASQILQQLLSEKQEHTDDPNVRDVEWEMILNLAIQILCESDFGQRWEIAKLFPKLGNRAIAPLISLLEDESLDLEIRWFVGRILSQFHHPDCVLALAKLTQQTQEEDLSIMAAQALSEIGLLATEALTELLQIPETRLLATKALSQMRHCETISPLLTVACDDDPNVRAIAIEALGSFKNSQIYPILVAALKDQAAKVRKEAIIALGYFTEKSVLNDTVNHLIPLLYDFKLEICQQTVITLGRLGTPEAIAALFSVLKSPVTPNELKQEIVRALGWIESVDALLYLQEALEWGDGDICQEIITVLSRQKEPQLKQQAAHILVEFYQSGQKVLQDSTIRQTLATSLGDLGEIEGHSLLSNLAQDNNQRVKLHAISALKKLTKQHDNLFEDLT